MGNGNNIRRVNDKLTRLIPPDRELANTGERSTEGHAARKPSLLRRAAAKGLDITGDAVTAAVGDKGKDLSKTIKSMKRGLLGPSTVAPAVSPYEATWLSFVERIDVSLELAHKVPEVMAPVGWALIVSSPLVRAQELLDSLKPLFPRGSGWEGTVSSCLGYMADIERAAAQLQGLQKGPNGSVPGEAQSERDTLNAKVREFLTDARIAMHALSSAFRKLVDAANYSADL